jgi:hypothetical protein
VHSKKLKKLKNVKKKNTAIQLVYPPTPNALHYRITTKKKKNTCFTNIASHRLALPHHLSDQSRCTNAFSSKFAFPSSHHAKQNQVGYGSLNLSSIDFIRIGGTVSSVARIVRRYI